MHALLAAGARRLRRAGSTSPRLDAELLLARATGSSREMLLAHPEREVDRHQQAVFDDLVRRRERCEPIAYLLGERDFYGRLFKVDRRALIPRPETELLVELGRAAVARRRAPRVVDVGTGAGAVAVSLAAETGVVVLATDLAWGALGLARANARALGQLERVRFVQTDLLAGLRGPLDVVLANLPYVPSGRLLPPDVADYEPPLALFGGPRGTELLERLLREARPLLAPDAEMALELDESAQAAPLADLARQLYPGAEVAIRPDASGYDRALWLRLNRDHTPRA